MMAARKVTGGGTYGTSDKKVFATGEKVFTKIGSGLWTAELYNQPVMLERVHHDHWKCINENTNKLLGEGSTRNEAMREAFYNEATIHGYDAREADRIHWILIPQKYRSYGGHKPRRKTVNAKVEGYRKLPSQDNVTNIQTRDIGEYSQDAVERIQKALAQYKTSYNKVLGGWHYYKRDNQGNIEDGKVYGPFKNEKEMFRDIMQREIKKFS